MKTRLGLVLATSALIGAGACASGSGGGSTAGNVSAMPEGADVETLDPGESPRENEHTEAADTYLDEAEAALEEGDEATARSSYSQAADAADEAITLDETNPLPWLQGGLAHIGLREYEVADSMLTRAQELRPLYEVNIEPIRENEWLELYNEAAPLVNEGDLEAAAPILEDAHAIYKQRPEVMFILGQIWVQQGRHDDAVEILQRGLELVEDEELRATLDEEALASWDEQAASIPVVLAQALANAARYEEAVEAFQGLLAEEPENLDYRRALANVYVQMEQPDSAAAIYDELLQGGGLSPDILYEIGIGLYQIELYEEAAGAFQDAVNEAPRDRDAAELWARSLQLAHPPGGEEEAATPDAVLEELLEASEAWLELDPNSETAHIITAQTANRLGNTQRASELIQEAEQLPVAMNNLQIQGNFAGGGTVRGTIQNRSMEQGSPVTIEVTFYGEGGAPVGTESVTVELPAVDANQSFEVVLESQERVRGYTYAIQGV